ncbi:MAG: PAS domain S-box protein, partial [Haloferacaceae archaeon]
MVAMDVAQPSNSVPVSYGILLKATENWNGGGTEQYDLLANRIRNAVERYRSERRAERLERVRDIVGSVNRALVRAPSREAVEEEVCGILADAEPYRLAVLAGIDDGTERVEPRTWAGDAEAVVGDLELTVGDGDAGHRTPGGRAYHEREVAVSQDLRSDADCEPWRDRAAEHGHESLAVVPLEYGDDLYGLLAVFADRPDAFDAAERDLLAELGDDVAHAVHAREMRSELRRKERRFDAVFEDPKMLVGLLAPDGTLLRVNPTAMEYVDADHEDVRGEPFPETPWWQDEDTDELEEWIERAAAGEYVDYQVEHGAGTDDAYAVEGTIRPVTDDAGAVTSLVVSTSEVTERREHERRLERYREYTDRLLDGIEDLFFVLDEAADMRRWNGRFTEVTGYADEEVEGMSGVDFVPASERERTVAAIERAFETGSARVEVPLAMKDGSTIPYEFTGNRVENPEGEPRLVSIGRDVSDRRELRERYELVVRTSTDAFWEWDPETDRTWRSDDYLTQFGYDPDADEGDTDWWRERVHPDDRDRVLDALERAVAEPETTYDEIYRFRRADGTYGHLRSRGTVVYDESGEPERMVGAHIDTTELMEARRELERLDEFASVVSHDLRNPLNVAGGHLELAREECDSDRLDAVARAHDRMEALIDDLLALAREGEAVEETEAVDLAEFAERCWRNVETNGATLVAETESRVLADRSRLQRLLENLLANAVEHGGDGVTVRVGDREDGSGFYVADDGPGIPEDERDRIFESGYSTDEDGTGFGLSIVEGIAEAHGWDVAVTGSPDGGARFEVVGVEHPR